MWRNHVVEVDKVTEYIMAILKSVRICVGVCEGSGWWIAAGHQPPALPPPAAAETQRLAEKISTKCQEMSPEGQSINGHCQACVGQGTSGG